MDQENFLPASAMGSTTLCLSALPFNLQLFAGEKTEPATDKKREEARQQGNLPKSQDLGSVVALLASFITLRFYGPYLFSYFADFMKFSLQSSMLTELTLRNTSVIISQLLLVSL